MTDYDYNDPRYSAGFSSVPLKEEVFYRVIGWDSIKDGTGGSCSYAAVYSVEEAKQELVRLMINGDHNNRIYENYDIEKYEYITTCNREVIT